MAASVNEKAQGDNKSLKLSWILFVWLSLAVRANQAGTMPSD
jgi:hypothetical protein